jgi:hypothetical protein
MIYENDPYELLYSILEKVKHFLEKQLLPIPDISENNFL